MEEASIMKRINFLQNHKTQELSSIINHNNQTMVFKFEQPKPNYLATFVYTDNITNKKFTITDELSFKSPSPKERMTHEDNSKHSINSNIKECLKLMKSTRNFHLNTLKNKNYKTKVNTKENISNDTETDIDIDKIHEEKLDRYLKNKEESKENYKKERNLLSRKLETSMGSFYSKHDDNEEIKKYLLTKETENNLSQNNHSSNSTYSPPKKFNKKQTSLNNKGSFQTLKDFILTKKEKNKNLEILNEDEVMKNINEQLKYKVRKNGEFLVTPNLSKRLMTENKENKNRYHPIDSEKANQFNSRNARQSLIKFALQNQNSRSSFKARETTQGDFYECEEIESFKFKFEEHPKEIRKMRLTDTVAHKKRPCETKIIKSIEKGNLFEADIELSVDPSLLEIKEASNGNNLLHICVMNNRVDIFEMILKKSTEKQIDLLSEKNKYGRTAVELGHILSFFTKNKLNSLIDAINKEKDIQLYKEKIKQKLA